MLDFSVINIPQVEGGVKALSPAIPVLGKQFQLRHSDAVNAYKRWKFPLEWKVVALQVHAVSEDEEYMLVPDSQPEKITNSAGAEVDNPEYPTNFSLSYVTSDAAQLDKRNAKPPGLLINQNTVVTSSLIFALQLVAPGVAQALIGAAPTMHKPTIHVLRLK